MCVSEDPLLVHQCTVPDSPHNGKAHFTAVAYKSVVTYKCKYGFMIVGDGTRTCGEDKHWSGTRYALWLHFLIKRKFYSGVLIE